MKSRADGEARGFPLPASVVCTFLVTAWLYFNATLNHFYVFGSGTDPLWFAGLMWHGDLLLHGPPGIDERSYYSGHFSPVLILPALLSYLLPFDHVGWLAVVLGCMHGFFTAVCAWCVWTALRAEQPETRRAEWLAAAFGLAVAVCPLQAESMGLPHYEVILPGFLIAFLVTLARAKPQAAAAWFVLLLLTREDAGFHALSFLVPVILFVRRREGRWLRAEIAYAFAAAVYSVAVFVLVPFLTASSSLALEHYVGTPAFAHVNAEQLLYRLRYLFLQNGQVWGPPAALLVAATLRRDPVLAVGGLAVLPWICLHSFLGMHPTAWVMGFYYPFPVLVTLAWPSVAALYRRCATQLADPTKGYFWIQAAVILLAFMPTWGRDLPNYGTRYHFFSFSSPYAAMDVGAYEMFPRVLREGRIELGNLAANLAAIGLAPFTLRRGEWLETLAADDREAIAKLDSILLFAGPYACPAHEAIVQQAGLPYTYRFANTRVWLFSRKTPNELETLSRALVRSHPQPRYCANPEPAG